MQIRDVLSVQHECLIPVQHHILNTKITNKCAAFFVCNGRYGKSLNGAHNKQHYCPNAVKVNGGKKTLKNESFLSVSEI